MYPVALPLRNRSSSDDRHMIRSPYTPPNPFSAMDAWANTLVKTRIPDLFRSIHGLAGHAQQIQNELNRLARVEGRSGDEVTYAIGISHFIRHALKQAMEEAESSNFVMPNNIVIYFHLLNDNLII